jgi:lysophospholipase L1-like esterase
MKNKLLTIGCSFTAGDELPDANTQSWSALLANKLNLELNNLGRSSGSNDYIFRTAVEETLTTKYDTVIVQWTEPSRMEFWYYYKPLTISPRMTSPHPGEFDWVTTLYKKHYNDAFRYKKWCCDMLALQGYFKSINQRYLFVNLAGLKSYYEKYYNELSHLWDKLDTEYYVGWPEDGLLEFQGDCPNGPGGHPLELGHERIADKIYEHIRNLSWIS